MIPRVKSNRVATNASCNLFDSATDTETEGILLLGFKLPIDVLKDLKRIVKPGGHIAFYSNRGGKVLLEENVLCATVEPIVIMINDQEFTKTANAWGVDNSKKGDTNRSCVF